MSVKPRTIDNLGVDSSIRYARDKEQQLADIKLIEESRLIPQKTEVTVLSPYMPTEFEAYLAPGKGILWAGFLAPPEFIGGKTLFSYQVIPSLGGYEKTEADMEKLEAMGDVLSKDQDQEKKRKALIALLKMIALLDRSLTLINSKRNQYQRG